MGFRPLVVAPIANRVVRRAILEVLQGYGDQADDPRNRWAGVPAVKTVMETPTSIGGIIQRGVPEGLALIDGAVRAEYNWFIRSDIQNFFTRIPKSDVSVFVRDAVKDADFARLFDGALATNLENQDELEERKLFKLFPDPKIGVAQGSALSALAGNIALNQFDKAMNQREIVCVRYIDDFILLGPSESKVRAAFRSARAMLLQMGMDAYDPTNAKACKDGKVDAGNIHDGTDFLGYRISARSRQPSREARTKFLAKLDKVVVDTKRGMNVVANGTSASHVARYHQAMVELHKIVWGWSQSFRHCTAKHVFEQLDREVDNRIEALRSHASGILAGRDLATFRRVMGVHLLSDTTTCSLPEVGLAH